VVDRCCYNVSIDDVVLFTALLLQMLQVRVDDPYSSCCGCVPEGVSVVCGRTTHKKFRRNAESYVDRCTTTPGIDDILTCRMVQFLPDNPRSHLPLAAAWCKFIGGSCGDYHDDAGYQKCSSVDGWVATEAYDIKGQPSRSQ